MRLRATRLGAIRQDGIGAPSAAPGYDIILIGGEANQFYGATKDNGLDVSDPRIYQLYSGGQGTADTVSPGGANDPLDHPDTSGVAVPAIGHTVRFAVDSYIGGGKLLSPRKILMVPNAYGGSRVINNGSLGWGVNPGIGNAPAIGTLVTDLITRANLAKALSGTNTVVLLDWHQVEGDLLAYSTFVPAIITKYRWALLSTLRYLRDQIGGNFPIVMGRATNWAINVGDGVNYIPANMIEADKIVRAICRRLPYVSYVDSINPSILSNGNSVHFDAAGQRAYAGREGPVYLEAVANSRYPTSPLWDDVDYITSAAGYTSGFTVSNGGLDLSGDANAGWKTAIATMPNQSATDKVYWEVKAAAVTDPTYLGFVGICNQDFALPTFQLGATDSNAGKDEASAGICGGFGSFVGGVGNSLWVLRAGASVTPAALNDVYMFALNRVTGKCWIGKNGTWVNSGDPAAGTNEWVSGIPTTDMVFIAASIFTGTGNTWRIQAKASDQNYLPPSGFSPWGA